MQVRESRSSCVLVEPKFHDPFSIILYQNPVEISLRGLVEDGEIPQVKVSRFPEHGVVVTESETTGSLVQCWQRNTVIEVLADSGGKWALLPLEEGEDYFPRLDLFSNYADIESRSEDGVPIFPSDLASPGGMLVVITEVHDDTPDGVENNLSVTIHV